MTDVVLATLNARYAHSALGLRYLFANLAELQSRACIREYTLKDDPLTIAEELLSLEPRIVGLSVYIWNVEATTRLVHFLKRLRPELIVVLGGPEVSHETLEQEVVRTADYVITGEADLAFAALCRRLLGGVPPAGKVIAAPLPEVTSLTLPYGHYSDEDVAQRVIYVEASRGCPFKCEFCLSSLDEKVRHFPQDRFFAEMDALLARGVNQFKFIDRTFNLRIDLSQKILEFFLERYRPGLFLHFEMIPDRLPEALRGLIARFPPGSLQLEVGIQTFDPAVCERISRHQDTARVEDNFAFLMTKSHAHVHADLIVGLPGEDLKTFGAGFDRLYRLRPQEIQVGILKRLRGTPIVRHTQEWGMVYSPHPPYEVLQTHAIDFASLQRLRRFSRFWDLVANSGNFREALPVLLGSGSPFEAFLRFSDWLFEQTRRTHSIALDELARFLFEYLLREGMARDLAGALVARDYLRPGTRRTPPFLAEFVASLALVAPGRVAAPSRQGRHLS